MNEKKEIFIAFKMKKNSKRFHIEHKKEVNGVVGHSVEHKLQINKT